jgi:Holliday junction DNA helicase RuvB
VSVDAGGCSEIARRSRGTPRVANRILRRVRDFAQVRHAGDITHAIAMEALDLFEVDHAGLERIDRAILRRCRGGSRAGRSACRRWPSPSARPDTIEDVYEPFLLQLGLLQRTPRGRSSRRRLRHLEAAAPARDPRLF